MSAVECPYHHKRWRGKLQCLMNGLRGRVLQGRHIRMLPGAVCVCAVTGRSLPPNQLDKLADLKVWFSSSDESVAALRSVRAIIDSFITSASDHSLNWETREAIVAVLSLVKDACKGDYRQLEADLKQSPPDKVKRFEEKFELSLPSHYLGVFMGHKGRHIKPLCQKHGVALKFGGSERASQSRGRYISGLSVSVVVRYEAGQWGEVEKAKEELTRRAEIVCDRRQQHERNVQEYSKLRAERYRVVSQQRLPSDVYRSPKEAASGQYSRKQQHKEKSSSSSKLAFAAVSEGHCLHCKSPYTPQELHEGACTYHSGFLAPVRAIDSPAAGYHWTCCDKKTPEQHATQELHKTTGCQNGRHAWRPGKPKAGGGRASKGDTGHTEDFYVN